MTQQEEKNLVERAKTDDAAFTQLYEHYLPRIYGYIYKRVGRRQEAEDITSQTFLKMVEHLKTFKGDFFKSWLYRIATNLMIDYFRTHRETRPLEEHEDMPKEGPMPHEEASRAEERKVILAALSSLPEKYQQVLHLKFYADLSNQEIALSLGITENNLGVLLHRSLEFFRKVYPKFTS